MEEKKTNSIDDDLVKDLILNGEYGNVAPEVLIQKVIDGKEAWEYADVNHDELKTYIKGVDESGWSWSNIDEYACDVVTVCRRRFKKKDIILCALLDDYSSRMTGMVLLNDKIYTFDQGKLEYGIEYAEIIDVDFTEDSVVLELSDGNSVSLYWYFDDCHYTEYSKNMYNLIMDIKDTISE